MTITIRPEHARLIAQAIEAGGYQSPDDVIARALEVLRSEEAWLAENKNEIDEKNRTCLRAVRSGRILLSRGISGRRGKTKSRMAP